MTYTLSPKEFHSVSGMSAEERFDYFVDAIIKSKEVWTLSSDQGTVLMSSEGEDCLPVWPHPDFAEQWVSGDWSDCTAMSIDLGVWLERWLPGMDEDGIALAVFPGTEEEGIVVTAKEMRKTVLAQQS